MKEGGEPLWGGGRARQLCEILKSKKTAGGLQREEFEMATNDNNPVIKE